MIFMKNILLSFGLIFIFFNDSNFNIAQTTQSSFVGTWKMNPSNPSHSLSKIKIVDNGFNSFRMIKFDDGLVRGGVVGVVND